MLITVVIVTAYNEEQMHMGELHLNCFETNAALHYHHFLSLLHITVYFDHCRRVAADYFNVCAPLLCCSLQPSIVVAHPEPWLVIICNFPQ